jgi:hypothetical protein
MEELLKKLVEDLDKQGVGALLILRADEDRDTPWSVSYEFGKEAEDSDMVGGAAYGLGKTAEEAVKQAASECGIHGDTDH